MDNIVITIDKSTPKELYPVYATAGAAGADLKAAENGVLQPNEIKLIPTGVRMAIPVGYEVQIRPRSGLAAKFGVTMVNTPGTIDSDYRGEVKIIMINHGKEPFEYKYGDRIAQMVVAKCEICTFNTDDIDETNRGSGGFGHTGI